MVYEVRPPVRVDKGTAVLDLARRLGDSAGTVSFVGDDRTDEDAFRALRDGYPDALTIRVTPTEELPTVAEYTLGDPEEVRVFLEELVKLRRG